MNPSAVEFVAVGKQFRSHRGQTVDALRDFSFIAAAKAITCLLGPSGCGKTTTLRLIAGLERADAGRILIHGRPAGALPGGIAYLPQQHTLFPWLRAVDNVAYPLKLRGEPSAQRRRRALELLALVGLADSAQLHPYECSGGMQQRLMMARQLACGEALWLMDEPFAAADERTRLQLQRLLLELKSRRDLSIVFVTHHVEEACLLGDKVVLMTDRPGRSQFELAIAESPGQRFDSPAHRERMGLLRSKLGA